MFRDECDLLHPDDRRDGSCQNTNRTTSEQREESVGVTSRQLFMTYPILREVLPQVACLSILVMPAVALLPAISLKGSELMSFGSMSSGLGFGAVAAAVLMQRNRRIIHHVTTVWTGGWVTCIAFAVLPASGDCDFTVALCSGSPEAH